MMMKMIQMTAMMVTAMRDNSYNDNEDDNWDDNGDVDDDDNNVDISLTMKA